MKISNLIVSFFWNNFDFFIRFFYCKTGSIGQFISKSLFWKMYSSDYKELDKTFEEFKLILKKNSIDIRNKTILELGPGNSHIIALNFLMHGAKKIALVDKFSRFEKNKEQKNYFNNEINFIAKKFGKESSFINNKLNNGQIEFVENDLVNCNLKNVDFIFSNSVLEHIKGAQKNVQAMSSILKGGGYMFHNIDLRDHYNFNSPFLFYKYSDLVWNSFLVKEGHSYTNRLRFNDFIRIFTENNFSVIYEKRKREKIGNSRLCKQFLKRDLADLETTFLQVLLKKHI